MQTNKTTTHLYNLDLLRALAIGLVVLQHSWTMSDMDTDQWGWLCHGYRILISVGVPLFIVLSGALLLDAPILPVRDFYKRRMSRVLLPFLLWATVVYVVSFVTHKYEEVTTWQDFLLCYLPYLLTNQINEFHWFIHLILALYLITPFLQRALVQSNQSVVRWLLVGWSVVLVLRALWPAVFMLHYTSELFPFLGCFVAGYYLKHYCQGKSLRQWSLAALGVLILVDVLTLARYSFVSMWMSVALTGLFLSFPMTNSPSRCALWLSVSRYSFMFYLVHIPIVRAILTASGAEADPQQPGLAFVQPIWLALSALTVCCLMGWVIDHLPLWVQHLTGVTSKKGSDKVQRTKYKEQSTKYEKQSDFLSPN